MRTAGEELTVCEYLRLINDLCQSDSEKDRQIRIYCAKGEKMGKILGAEVSRLNPKFLLNPKLYEKQNNWKELLELRLRDTYKQEGSYR